MPKIRMFQVDAFAERLFNGNPAAVCPLSAWLPVETMQAIAAENNLSETAFFVARPGEPDTYDIRWFTPVAEVDLAGHPTLATAFVIFSELRPTCDRAVFVTARQDRLTAVRSNGRIAIDFPARPAIVRPDLRQSLEAALGVEACDVLAARDALVVLKDEAAVLAVQPNFEKIAAIDVMGVIVTAVGQDCDFVSRFFAPRMGIAEDPVTGSAHCTLASYWAERLGRDHLHARQLSTRGGEVWCTVRGGRVTLEGQAVFYLDGWIALL